MGSCRLAEMRLEVAERVKPLTLPERVEALERRVAEIESTRAVEGELLSREACRAQAAARENLRQRYAAAAPERLEHLRAFAAEKMLVHAGFGCVPAAVRESYRGWLLKHGLVSSTSDYETPEELEAALLELLPDATRGTVLNEANYAVPGVIGIALLPPDKSAEQYIAEIETAAAERERLKNAEAERLRNVAELARIQAKAEQAAIEARVNKQLADAYFAELYRKQHAEPSESAAPGNPMEQELERREAAAPA